MASREDIRSWLRANGHSGTAHKIDLAVLRWASEGKSTRRNWWDVLAGDRAGKPRRIGGILFPVIGAVRARQRIRLSSKMRSGKVVKRGRQVAPSRNGGHREQPVAGGGSVRPRVSSDLLVARPFVKWAGGKRQLLSRIREHLPDSYGTYHEPFLGGGALFFALRPAHAFLSDSNERLVRCYNGVRNHVKDVISLLKGYKRSRSFFLDMRQRDVDSGTDAEVAAWFIYLNKTGFNGLYRVNSKNKFNVPYGDNKNAQICDEENLKACSAVLQNAKVQTEDFSKVLERAQEGDLVYFDPPYVPLSATSYFTSYTAQGFNRKDQLHLRDVALELKRMGVHVIISNSSSSEDLYTDKQFSMRRVLASRPVNSKAERRGKITELLIS
jgi:DNA adenine methylase